MKEPVLVIMAAGMGSRYGGLKQIDPVDREGHVILDFSIYDAVRAGFQKVVFVIKREIEKDFKEAIGNRISLHVGTQYVYQSLSDLPSGFSVPEGRKKPWGTAHAVYCCKDTVHSPFAVINADDFYGRHAFEAIYQYLKSSADDEKYRFAMVGYRLGNTLTEHGYVSRGICEIGNGQFLKGVRERTHIEKRGAGAEFTEDGGKTWTAVPKESIVSMNLWGFSEHIFPELETQFSEFLSGEAARDPRKAEYFLPSVVNRLLKEGRATVKVLKSEDRWYGVTYKEDKKTVSEAVCRLKAEGIYPEKLWEASR